MLIRLFTPTDEPAVVALWREALPGTAPHNDPAASIRAKLADGGDLFFVAEADGQVVGTVMGGYDGHRGWLYSAAVRPAHRRRGVGTAIIRHVEASLADRGCLKVNLQVLVSNAEVVTFYQSLGYAVEEWISMGKRLY